MSGPLVVIGDALLDVDVIGRAQRLCPDAPVPVLDELTEQPRPGGAALAAALAADDGNDVVLITPLGDDEAGEQLRALLEPRGLRLVALPQQGGTVVKRRVRSGGQSLLRLDSGGGRAHLDALPSAAEEALSDPSGVLVSDYGRGLTAVAAVRDRLTELARTVPVVWDPHPRGSRPVPGVRLVTPNAAEAAAFALPPADTDRATGAAGAAAAPSARTDVALHGARAAQLVHRWQAHAVAITRGSEGAVLSHGHGSPMVLLAPSVQCLDPCGAGDRFAATAAQLLATGAVTSEAVQRAVDSAAVFVACGGAAGVLQPSGPPRDDTPEPSAVAVVRRVRERPDGAGAVVATGGCFDLLHAGHVASLRAARRLGDCLVVCVNSDASTRRLKGPTRPLVPAADRVRVLEALECVDAVVVFDEDTPADALRELRPDIWAKGGDYEAQDLPEAAVLEEWGGQAVVLPYLAGRSTTRLVESAVAPSTEGRH
ncbi:MAG TPA: PfkB family carbohydrate kinase [Nocardioidaceae bacterium]|nr:PfkB family carbohydrate kinase [Nocardioidaceae bacterium]